MGTYYIPANLDRREYFHPHRIGYGLKRNEQIHSMPSMGAVLLLVLHERWNGDRVAMIGDGGGNPNDADYYEVAQTWRDISPVVRAMMAAAELCGPGNCVQEVGRGFWR